MKKQILRLDYLIKGNKLGLFIPGVMALVLGLYKLGIFIGAHLV